MRQGIIFTRKKFPQHFEKMIKIEFLCMMSAPQVRTLSEALISKTEE